MVSAKAPPITPPNVTALSMVRAVSAVRADAPLKVRVPVLLALPKAREPESDRVFVIVKAVAELEEKRPPEKVKVPVPKAALLAT